MPQNDLENALLRQKHKTQSLVIFILLGALITVSGAGGAYIYWQDQKHHDQIMAKREALPDLNSKVGAPVDATQATSPLDPSDQDAEETAPTLSEPAAAFEPITPAPPPLNADETTLPDTPKATISDPASTPAPPVPTIPATGTDLGKSDPEYDARPVGEQAEFGYPVPDPAPVPPVTVEQSPIVDDGFARILTRAYDAIDTEDFTAADGLSMEAHRLAKTDQDRADLAILQTALDEALRQNIAENSVKQADKAAADDNWHQALRLYDQAAKFGSNPNLDAKLQRASTIANDLDQAQKLLDDPYLLQKREGRKIMTALKSGNAVNMALSPDLKDRISRLRGLETKMKTPVDILVTSDGESFVIVVGVGKIGAIDEKVIRLKPGHYQFEASREGYQNHRIDVTIPYDAEPRPIHITAGPDI